MKYKHQKSVILKSYEVNKIQICSENTTENKTGFTTLHVVTRSYVQHFCTFLLLTDLKNVENVTTL